MTRPLLFIISIMFFSGILYAQETTGSEDPYADYSYLWENTGKKKKSKKSDPKTETQVQPQQVVEAPASIPTDTIPSNNSTVASDSTFNQPSIPADSLTNQLPVLSDTVQVEEPQIEETPQPEEEPQTEPEEIEKPKKERKEVDPNKPQPEDFRAGMASSGGAFTGGFTYTQIGGQNYIGMVLSPEFSIWKIGVGMNVPILYGLDDKSIRTEMFKGGVGAARLFTYIRYGVQKKDPVYVKVGQLNNTMIGFGGLVNNYTNSISYEQRKLGLHYDLNYKGLVGLEGMYSDFDPNSFNLFVMRPYVRPMSWSAIPIVRTIEFGATVVQDKDQTRTPLSDSTYTTNYYTKAGMGAFGLDMGMTLLNVPFIQIDLFANYGKLNPKTDSVKLLAASLSKDFTKGHGVSAGFNFRFHFIADVFTTDIRVERLSYSNNYIPQFFNTGYELNKDASIRSLVFAQKTSGFYGSLTGQILQKVQLGGALMIPDNISASTPALVRVNADIDRLGDKISVHGSYIKSNLTSLSEAFTFDSRSITKVRFIYHLNKFLAAGVDYYWLFTQVGDGEYKATKYVMPYFGVSIPL